MPMVELQCVVNRITFFCACACVSVSVSASVSLLLGAAEASLSQSSKPHVVNQHV